MVERFLLLTVLATNIFGESISMLMGGRGSDNTYWSIYSLFQAHMAPSSLGVATMSRFWFDFQLS